MRTETVNGVLAKPGMAVELKGVHKRYLSDSGTEVDALTEVDFTVKKGEFVTMIGATGCGKTTLLNIIAGLETVESGEVRLAADLRLGQTIAYVFQHYTLFPWRSVLDNVTFGLRMHGVGRRARNKKARELLSQVGLSEFENSYPHELSGGMRQRAAIAQTLALQPKLLLMDEPFGAVDDSTRRDLQRMLTDLWQQNKTTILFVTHNVDEALLMGDRVLVFRERPGKILGEFEIDLPRPRNRVNIAFTELFIKVRQTLSVDLD